MKPKHLIAAALALLLAVPVWAVFNEKELEQTLSELRIQLQGEVEKQESRQGRILSSHRMQHGRMIDIIRRCNELSLMLYSQNQDFTFDMTYALKQVTAEYEEFNSSRTPYDDIVVRLDLEIDRYARLVESLRRLPPRLEDVSEIPDSLKYRNDTLDVRDSIKTAEMVERFKAAAGRRPPVVRRDTSKFDRVGMQNFFLNEQGREDRDTCIHYAAILLNMYSDAKASILSDSEYYEDAALRLKESYEYAQNRYKVLQKKMFVTGQTNYFMVLKTFRSSWRKAYDDAYNKYSRRLASDGTVSHSEWRGPIVLGFMALVIVYLIVAFLFSLLIVKIVTPHVKWMQAPGFAELRTCFVMLCTVILFALSVWIGARVLNHSFFTEASGHLLTFSWLLASILLSVLIRLRGEANKCGMRLYLPVVLLGMIVITFRIVFVPNSMINIVLPPILLAVSVWQGFACRNNMGKVGDSDRLIGWISFGIVVVCTVSAWIGYIFLSIQIVIWWLFQVAAIETVIAIVHLLDLYRDTTLMKQIAEYKLKGSASGFSSGSGAYFKLTWLYDFVRITVVPVLAVISVPFCMWLALQVFDLSEIFHMVFTEPVIDFIGRDGSEIMRVSLKMLIVVVVLFFVFKYVSYAIKAIYRDARLAKMQKASGKKYIHTNEVNLTLANNLIGITVWGSYVIMLFWLFKIPTGAISTVAAGLAAGLGLAMKDILNNFICSIQLMSGRLRVGDWVECDGVRGQVTAISYQSTQIETIDGAVMSFLNANLFNKNFKNLTRNNAYEFLKIVVNVEYGSDVEKVRNLVLEDLKQLQGKDKFGREIVEQKYGVVVVFDSFGDSSVNLAVKQYILVQERYTYEARAKEIIYNTLNANGITIPFPQSDVHIIQ